MRAIAGVDGCSSGWLVAIEQADRRLSLRVAGRLDALLSESDLSILVIDMPIGLTERAPREADRLARRLLGRRGCTVFPAPYRAMLDAVGHPPEIGQVEASRIRRALDGKGCSRQAYMIFGKIDEVDTSAARGHSARLVEGHPEVSFAQMNQGRPVMVKKARVAGRERRLELLDPYFGDLTPFVRQGRTLGVQPDDVLDAFAMLWTARRLRDDAPVLRLPDPAEPVTRGMVAQIVA